ncbi:uncharacterized protein LOC116304823 [Actinia tenebrosa]|uniref:Uncharacterized protein LOC116304823 n=1 Tax=Actinia tenebrosa TaxID=6105 RepID=A0A6P8IWQ6_ACTTE|nr:uncharacterized protein LOC116304823 [Actinia tenebrosa]
MVQCAYPQTTFNDLLSEKALDFVLDCNHISLKMSKTFNQSDNFNSLNESASRNVEGRRHSGFCVPSILIEDWSEVNFEETLASSSSRGAPTALKGLVEPLRSCNRQMCPQAVLQDCKSLCQTV